MGIFQKRVGILNFVIFFKKSLIGLNPIWFVFICVSPMWQFKQVLRHFHMCSCIVHSCCSLLHALCLTECPCDIFVLNWTQLSANAWVYSWLNMFNIFWSMSVCFTHFPILCHAMPCHAPLRHTHAHHMHTHAQSLNSCIMLLFTCFNSYSMMF